MKWQTPEGICHSIPFQWKRELIGCCRCCCIVVGSNNCQKRDNTDGDSCAFAQSTAKSAWNALSLCGSGQGDRTECGCGKKLFHDQNPYWIETIIHCKAIPGHMGFQHHPSRYGRLSLFFWKSPESVAKMPNRSPVSGVNSRYWGPPIDGIAGLSRGWLQSSSHW